MKNIDIYKQIQTSDVTIALSKWKISKRNIKQEVFRYITPKGKSAINKKAVIAAAALVLCIAACIGAYGFSPDFKALLQSTISGGTGEVQVIEKSVSGAGVKMTIQSAARRGSSAMIWLVFTKEGGTRFTDSANIESLVLQCMKDVRLSGLTYTKTVYVSQDKKQLHCLVDVQVTSEAETLPIAVSVGNINNSVRRITKKLDLDLQAAYKAGKQDKAMHTNTYGAYVLKEVGFQKKQLVITAEFPQDPYSSEDAADYFGIGYLSDTKTNKIYTPETVQTTHLKEGCVTKQYFFKGISEKNLSSLALFYSYDEKETYSGNWDLTADLDLNSRAVITDLTEKNEIQVNMLDLKLETVCLTAQGLIVQGEVKYRDFDPAKVRLQPVLVYKDHKEHVLGENDSGTFSFNGNRFTGTFFTESLADIETVKYININGIVIEL